MKDVSAEIGGIAERYPLDIFQDQAPTPAVVERDNVFYFETVSFQVEDALFRVFKSGFEVKGTPFEAMFSLPQVPGPKGIVEGTDDSSPIYLRGISKVNFRCFLRALYPFKGAPTTYAEWIAALDLAIMWDFKEVRNTCIEALSELIKSRTAIDNILLAKKYKVKKWLRDGYIRLLQQKELEPKFINDICTSEIDLPMITIVRLLYIREKRHCELHLQHRDQSNTRSCRRCSSDDYHFTGSTNDANRKVDEVFADEIARMPDDYPEMKSGTTIDETNRKFNEVFVDLFDWPRQRMY